MGPLLHPALAGALLLAGPPASGASSARALVLRAVEALGGAGRLARYPAATWKGKGVLHGGSAPLAFRVTGARAGPDRLAVTVQTLDTDPAYRRVLVLDRTRGWLRLDGTVRTLPKEALAAEGERAYAGWVATVAPLTGGGFDLGPAPPATVAGRPALGVRVRAKARPDVTLYFDREDALPLKRVMTARDPRTGKEVREEVVYGDYGTAGGVKYPRRVRVYRDGRLVSDTEITGYHPAEKLGEKTFARP